VSHKNPTTLVPHFGHAADLTATQLGKNKKKREEKVDHTLSLFNGIFSSSSSSKTSPPPIKKITLFIAKPCFHTKTKLTMQPKYTIFYYPSIKHNAYQDLMFKYRKKTSNITWAQGPKTSPEEKLADISHSLHFNY